MRTEGARRRRDEDLVQRIFENRNHIINMLKLDRNTILSIPTDAGELVGDEEDDPLACAICGLEDASADNPIIKCDGEHETEVGVHLRCMEPPLDAPPEDEWFCAALTRY